MSIRDNLPPALLRSLDAWPLERPAALLIRHGDRHEIPPGAFGDECTLTTRGLQRARALGSTLPRGIPLCARTSPLLRCVQTVEAIAEGAEVVVEPVSDPLLGEPGAYVVDRTAAGRAFLERGTERVVLDLVAGVPHDGIRTSSDGGMLLLEGLADSLPAERGLCVCVSHDSIVLPFLAWATSGAYPAEAWLDPLDGGLVWRERGALRVAWNGRVFTPPSMEEPC